MKISKESIQLSKFSAIPTTWYLVNETMQLREWVKRLIDNKLNRIQGHKGHCQGREGVPNPSDYVWEPLAKVIEGKWPKVERVEKSDLLLVIWSVTLESKNHGPRDGRGGNASKVNTKVCNRSSRTRGMTLLIPLDEVSEDGRIEW